MPEYRTPGVYVEEYPSGPRPIEGVATSTAGMVGATERGPLRPRLVTSWSEYLHWFGGSNSDSSLPLAVRGFFENGGRRLFVARIAGTGSMTATMNLATGGDPLVLSAIGPGAWGNQLLVRVQPGSLAASPGRFRLTIEWPGGASEDYDNLTADPQSADFFVTLVNERSRLVTIAPGPASAPLPGNYTATGGTTVVPTAADFVGGVMQPADQRTGLSSLESIDDISILVVPDEASDRTGTISSAIIEQCERLKDRFAIVSAPRDVDRVDALRPPHDSSYAAFYFPWIRVSGPGRTEPTLVPPGGHIAGIYARTDVERGVHKAPANEVVRGLIPHDPQSGVTPLQFTLTDRDQHALNERGVNVIRDFTSAGRGARVWGARTMSSDPEWKYVNVRRFFMFVEESIDEGTQWVVFEPNNDTTWTSVRRIVTDFLRRLWQNGALVGATEREAFFVRCDRTTMTQDDIDHGRLVCEIGIAPLRPAEFVIFRISKMTRT
jgi:hypothetical protein